MLMNYFMRKIISKHEEGRKRKRNQLIVGGVLIFIMFFSVLGYSFRGGDENTKKINYNGFEFINQNDFWILNTENFYFVFKNNPKQVEEIGGDLEYLENYYDKPLYIYSENSESEIEIYRNLFYQNQIVQRMQSACLDENITNTTLGERIVLECDENLPIKNCEDNFIIIKEDNNTKITQNKNCVFIFGQQENLTKITDEFLFKILGIREQQVL